MLLILYGKKAINIGVINDPHRQPIAPAGSDFRLIFKKVGTDERTGNLCENSDHYQPWLGSVEWIKNLQWSGHKSGDARSSFSNASKLVSRSERKNISLFNNPHLWSRVRFFLEKIVKKVHFSSVEKFSLLWALFYELLLVCSPNKL